jgi:hypothetical protein
MEMVIVTIAQEMFRFVTTRRPETVAMHRINSRLIRDGRTVNRDSLLTTLFGPGDYQAKLVAADAFAVSPNFLAADDPEMLVHGPAVDFFRSRLATGLVLADLAAETQEELPAFAALLGHMPPAQVLEVTAHFLGRAWDSFYSFTTIGFDRYISTNCLADVLRLYQVLRLLWLSREAGLETWAGGTFDEYEVLIDLKRAAAAGGPGMAGAATAAAIGDLSMSGGVFRVPLSVGAIQPPSAADLNLVEQTLLRYEPGDLAASESIMRGERREHTVRTLARTSQTTTTETSSEQEETSSFTTDQRFSLAAQAQQTATESFGVQAGVTVSAKFGPVQVGASVNASFDTSSSTSQSTSQEYAKTITEEATKRVQNSFKETSSITIVNETQDTTLRGFNNEKGDTHVNGFYRWIDTIYTARLLNYGRRLMFRLNVPEPSASYRAVLSQKKSAVLDELEEPIAPAQIDKSSLEPLPASDTTNGFLSFHDIDEANYAKVAARYDVTGILPPPAEFITGSKAIVYPEAMQAIEMPEHDHRNDLSYVSADNTLTVDPDYRVTQVGVYATTGEADNLRPYADALKLGEDKDEANHLLVQVGDRSFYLSVTGDGNNQNKIIDTNFNLMQTFPAVKEGSPLFADVVKPALPITITANFEGMLTFNVMYAGYRRDEALDAWKSQTYAAIVKGYTTQKQAYDQAVATAQAQTQATTEEQTFQLRADQYRSIELTELKRGCIDLLTEGTAAGHTSIAVAEDGAPTIVYDEAEGSLLNNWRSPLANGAVAEFFELCFAWDDTTYTFEPYYWAGSERWRGLSQASGSDPVFEKFLGAGSASVVVPVRPGYERSVLLFLKTSRLWAGGYLGLFNDDDMLAIYADVERGLQIDPPEQVGEPWEIRVPTNMVMLQEEDTLPVFPVEAPPVDDPPVTEPVPDENVPF